MFIFMMKKYMRFSCTQATRIAQTAPTRRLVSAISSVAIAFSSGAIAFSGNAPGLLAESLSSESLTGRSTELALNASDASAIASRGYGLDFPADIGAPQRTVGAGTRGGPESCLPGEKALPLSLMPTTNADSGTTVSSNPAFFFYVPKTTAKTGEFLLVDDAWDEVYITEFELPRAPGVIKVSLPKTVELEVGREYKWQFMIVCNQEDRSADRFVLGKLEREQLSPEMEATLEEEPNPIERAKLYARAKIWYEALTQVASARSQYPGAWEELLRSAGLGAIATEPIADCCTPEN